MKYVFDNGSLIILFNFYYESRFPTLWKHYYESIDKGQIISVREVAREIDTYQGDSRLKEWAKEYSSFFEEPTTEELLFIEDIFKVAHFQDLISKKSRLQGKPVADPFVIAKARQISGCVVTQELFKENAAKIPNVCNHFNIPYTNLEGFMEKEGWEF